MLLIVAALGALAAGVAHALPGDLDPTFSEDGKVTTDFGLFEIATGVALQPDDGKIVVAGYTTVGDDFALARYDVHGGLDPAFGAGGEVTSDFGRSERVFDVATQTDGKIVVAGASDAASGNHDFALARYHSDGRLDTRFGDRGRVTTDFGGEEFASAVAIQPDGKIVAAGVARGAGLTWDFAVVRYRPDGKLDLKFGDRGKVRTDFFGSFDEAYALAVQSDGKIVAAGISATPTGIAFALARYSGDGSLDTGFGTNGKVTTSGGGLVAILDLALQPDGRIVAAGRSINAQARPGWQDDVALVRYSTDGALDAAFGNGGKVTTDFGGNEVARAVAIQGDGKIVAAGRSRARIGTDDFALIRYDADGALDLAFGVLGQVTTDFRGTEGADAVAVQADGKIVAVGFSDAAGSHDFALARYTP